MQTALLLGGGIASLGTGSTGRVFVGSAEELSEEVGERVTVLLLVRGGGAVLRVGVGFALLLAGIVRAIGSGAGIYGSGSSVCGSAVLALLLLVLGVPNLESCGDSWSASKRC